MLPRKNRIPRNDFPSHNVKGFRVFSPLFTGVFFKSEANNSRASVVVSKKTAKTAVDRNKLRRRFYDVVGPLFNQSGATTTVVLYPKIEAKKSSFADLETEMKKAFKTAKLIK
ncbi:MAG: ribonuclease P protein component [Candidatus Paceibacterota bacterium]|jgi:ribonuclease P protein component